MRQLSPELLAQLYGQESNDPFLTLLTLSHTSFTETIYLVNNTKDITSRGNVFMAFPFNITLPADDGETAREVEIVIDNTSLELVEELRKVSDPIDCKVEMILASRPDETQISLEELKIKNVTYNKSQITAKLLMDDFLSTELASEKYTPTIYPGLF